MSTSPKAGDGYGSALQTLGKFGLEYWCWESKHRRHSEKRVHHLERSAGGMNASPVCIIYTQNPVLARRVKAFLRATAEVRHVADANRLDAVLQQTGPALLVMDLGSNESRDLIERVQNECPDVLIVALGIPGSDPLREAESFGIYAVEDVELDRRQFQAMTGRAFDNLRLAQENREL